MKLLQSNDYRVMPWRNGQGSTTEIAIFPENASLETGFLWRFSITDVVADGPFSQFPGFDRHIMVIEGNGMMLDAGADGIFDMSQRFSPVQFTGELRISGKLRSGPVRDLNLMVQRAYAESRLTVVKIAEKHRLPESSSTKIAHMLEGQLLASGHVLAESDTLIIDAGEAVSFAPLDVKAVIALGEITPLRT